MASDVGPLLQNFSASAGNSLTVNFDINPDQSIDIVGASIYWYIYGQTFGVPSGDPIITKSIDDGLQVDDPDLIEFHADLEPSDTQDLQGNYYHEVLIIDRDGKQITTTYGIMTVTQAIVPSTL